MAFNINIFIHSHSAFQVRRWANWNARFHLQTVSRTAQNQVLYVQEQQAAQKKINIKVIWSFLFLCILQGYAAMQEHLSGQVKNIVFSLFIILLFWGRFHSPLIAKILQLLYLFLLSSCVTHDGFARDVTYLIAWCGLATRSITKRGPMHLVWVTAGGGLKENTFNYLINKPILKN